MSNDTMLTYKEAKKAVELFEAEYIGQEQSPLWVWAVQEAIAVIRESK
jgi:hypothetical protein